MKDYACRDCGNEFQYDNSKPGRPPVRCEDCRVKKQRDKENPTRIKTSLSAIERVDRLEAMLKSRGLHLSQQEERY